MTLSIRKAYVKINRGLCKGCNFCKIVNVCYSPSACVGCLSCYYSCPYEARIIEYRDVNVEEITICVDGIQYKVPCGITVAKALQYIGFKFDRPGSKRPSLACETGGCWACALVIDGSLERTCIMPVTNGMRISTDVDGIEPKRIVHGPSPHRVGGKATPWWQVDYVSYVEAAIWVSGCNLRCPQCQNYAITYDNISDALTPKEAAHLVVACHKEYNTRGIAISGGEPTLNRRWLIEFFREVTRYVKSKVRRHLDSNGTLLKPDYIDELVEAGCNNMGVEPKCVNVETYMRITGLRDREIAKEYLETSWRAIEYIEENYSDKVYLGVGLVYNKELVSLDEIAEAGRRIAEINPNIQVTVLDYFPAFRRRDLKRPTVKEMLKVKKTLEEQGLKTVIVQTEKGHIGPGDRNVSPLWI